MQESIAYKIISGKIADVEKEINNLAAEGWRVVASTGLSQNVNQVAVILERGSA